jgi:NADH-quinone oxidoreductase subunit B
VASIPVTIGGPDDLASEVDPARFVLDWGLEYSVWLFNFGLACCAVEFAAATMSHAEALRADPLPAEIGSRHADLVVISGTVTDKMAPAIREVYDRLPTPKYVVSFGSCANCGGPYWDSYCVTKGVDQLIPVDLYVPGCPPRPEALLEGLASLQGRIGAGSR